MFDRSDVLAEQQRYYRARAPEDDDWWFRRGRYDRGADANAAWSDEVGALERLLCREAPLGDALELACGTGLWTRHLVRLASSVVAVDGSPEALALCRDRVAGPVSLVRADLFDWDPPVAAFDTCFFGFWLSHVPEERFDAFWSTVARALRPGGSAIVVDSLATPRSTAADHVLPGKGEDTMTRRLDDGREFRIVKRFLAPDALRSRVRRLGWDGEAVATGEFFLFARLHADH